MLPADTSIGSVHLTVTDFDAASRFYQEVLGFRPGLRAGGHAAFSATGAPPFSLILTGRPGATRRRSAGLYHFAVLVPSRRDLGRALRHLMDVGAPMEGASDHGVSEAIYLHDGEGNGIEIYADRPRERWTIQRGGLVMPTRPLDVEALLAQDDAPWEGLPAGTRIGHIHLRVADLDRSERFYAGLLGFDIMVRTYPGALFLAAGGYHHHIGLNIWAGSGIPPMAPDAAGLRYFTVVIPDGPARAEVVGRLRQSGAPASEAADGPISGTLVRDPDGIGVLLTS